jgi:hypothetical protein
MNFHSIAAYFFVLIIGTVATNYASGQVDPLTEINFLQSGLIYSDDNQLTLVMILQLEGFLTETLFIF